MSEFKNSDIMQATAEFFSNIPDPNINPETKEYSEWETATMYWASYPIGTRARQSWEGGYWEKTKSGWKWFCGDTLPTPGAADQVCFPKH